MLGDQLAGVFVFVGLAVYSRDGYGGLSPKFEEDTNTSARNFLNFMDVW